MIDDLGKLSKHLDEVARKCDSEAGEEIMSDVTRRKPREAQGTPEPPTRNLNEVREDIGDAIQALRSGWPANDVISILQECNDSLALAGPQNGQWWVRVEDRLPEDDSDVFAAIWWRNGDNPAYSHYVIHDCSYYEGGTGSGQKIFTDCEGEEFEHTDVSYWIYKKDLAAALPAPPTGDAPTEKKL